MKLKKIIVVFCLLCFNYQIFSQTLPSWFENSRAHAHSIYNFQNIHYGYNTDYYFKSYSEYFKVIGAKVNTRHVKSNAKQGATWCSSVGRINNANEILVKDSCDDDNIIDIDIPQKVIDSSHQQQIAQILYYKHYFDEYWEDKYDNWKSIDEDSLPNKPNNQSSIYLCPNTTFRDTLKVRINELIAKGADAMYFDYVHANSKGCWCTSCANKFPLWSGSGGQNLPDTYKPIMTKYYNEILREHFIEIQNDIHAINPNAIAIVSTSRLAALNFDGISQRLAEVVDVAKTEYAAPLKWAVQRYFYEDSISSLYNYRIPHDVRLGTGWSTLRDLTKNRVLHSWVNEDSLNEVDDAVFTSNQLVSYLGAAYAHGFVINPHHKEDKYLNGNFNEYLEIYDLDSIVAPHLAYKRPVKYTAILYDEDIKYNYLHDTIVPTTIEKQENYWQNYLLAFHASFEAVKNFKNYTPNYSTTNDTLYTSFKSPVYILKKEDLLNDNVSSDIKNIIVPNSALNTAAINQKLIDFDNIDTNHVVNVDITNNFYLKTDSPAEHIDKLKTIRNSYWGANKPPIYIKTNNETANNVIAEFYEATPQSNDEYEYVVTLTNEFTWATQAGVFKGYPTTTTLPAIEPNTIANGALSIRIPSDNPSLNISAINLITNESLSPSYNSNNNQYIIPVKSFDLISAIAIDMDPNVLSTTKEELFINIYPNPTNKSLNFKSNNNIESIEVYNLVGQLVKKYSDIKDDKIDVSKFTEGIYIFKFLGNNTIIKKIIISN